MTHPYGLLIVQRGEIGGRANAYAAQPVAMKRHGMFSDRHACSGKVGDEALFEIHLPQRRSGRTLFRHFLQQRSGWASGILDLPERIAPMGDFANGVEPADFCQ